MFYGGADNIFTSTASFILNEIIFLLNFTKLFTAKK